ncbi:MAG: cytochrome P450 [Pseudomonadales bacterium]
MRAPLYSSQADELLSEHAILNPHALYDRLRCSSPVARIAESGVHLVTSWELVHEALDRESDFSANLTGVLYRGADGQPACFELPQSVATAVIATADEPRHSVHRALLQARFTPSSIASFEQPVKQWADQVLSPLIAAGGGDAMDACERVPALVVAHLLGLPVEDVDDFRVWAMMGGDMLAGEVTGEGLTFLATETARMSDYLGRHFDSAFDNISSESDAPLMHTLAAGVQAGQISREEALGIAIVLFGAGGESTAALIASCFKILAERPDLFQQLRVERSLINRFVEEVVRLESPFKFHYRSVKTECELGGYALQPGDRLMLVWAAANRDGQALPEAHALRLDRKHAKQHTGFGRGAHFCIGAVLARLEAKIMIECLLDGAETIELVAQGAAYANSIFVRRLNKLQLNIRERVV